MNDIYETIIDLLRSQRNLLIVGHEKPDCDCLGSVQAIYRAFDGKTKNWQMLLADEVPSNLRFLPLTTQMRAPETLDFSAYDAVLLVDCSEPLRCGEWLPPLLSNKKLYCIDHHMNDDVEATLALIEPEAAAAAEIVAELIRRADISPDDETALCLYSAIAADTGGFRYNNTTPRALRLSAELRPQIDIELVRIQLFENRTLANIKMLTVCLNNMQTECDGLLCYGFIPYSDMQKHGATAADCHDIVNHTLSLSGVKVGILFEEYADHVKMSLRCRRGYRVDMMAKEMSGGGHMLAAGCKLYGNLTQIMPTVLDRARHIITDKQ